MSTALVAMVTKVGRNRATLLLRYTFAEFFFFFFFSDLDSAVSLLCATRGWNPDGYKEGKAGHFCGCLGVWCWAACPEMMSSWSPVSERGDSCRQVEHHIFTNEVCGRRRETGKRVSLSWWWSLFLALFSPQLHERKMCFDLDQSQVCVCVLVPVSLFLIFFCASHPSRPAILHFGFFFPQRSRLHDPVWMLVDIKIP